jgi:hypothetical protein
MVFGGGNIERFVYIDKIYDWSKEHLLIQVIIDDIINKYVFFCVNIFDWVKMGKEEPTTTS